MRTIRYILARSFFWILGLSLKSRKEKISNVWINSTSFPHLNFATPKISEEDSNHRNFKTEKRDLKFSKIKSKRLLTFNRVTSGTTGIRAEIALDREDLSRMLGVRDYCFQYYGLNVGAREARCWGEHHVIFKKRIIDFVMNRKYFYPVGSRSDREISELETWDPDYIYGYSSLIINLAKAFEISGSILKNLKLVICTAETILPHQKRYLSKVFGVPVVEEYGSTEFDIIAFECAKGHLHIVNPWLSFVENESNTLITDCARTYQPISKYDLGDDLIIGVSTCNELGSLKVINRINGRSIDMLAYTASGNSFHSVEFAYAFDEYFRVNDKVFDFKVIQNRLGKFNICISEKLWCEEKKLEEFIRKFVSEKIGEDIEVIFDKCKDFVIDRNKRSYFVQNLQIMKSGEEK